MDVVLYHLDTGAPLADLAPEPAEVRQDEVEAPRQAA